MLLFWKIRYLDTNERVFKYRSLWLDTADLDATTRAAVEYLQDLKQRDSRRELLKYRHLFKQENFGPDELKEICERQSRVEFVSTPDYFEDQDGNELTGNQIAAIITGDPEAIMLPSQAQSHDVEYIRSEKRPISLDKILLSAEELSTLGNFARDFRHFSSSAFLKEGPGSWSSSGTSVFRVETAVTKEELDSFVTIFRRLYLEKEPGNFLKAVNVFCRAARESPLAKWVKGVRKEYQARLQSAPKPFPMIQLGTLPFNGRELIDSFLNSQFAHQAKKAEDVERFAQYQSAVGDNAQLLTWLFLQELWIVSLHLLNAGRVIERFFNHYCAVHERVPAIIKSLFDENPGIGSLEKTDERRKRLLREKAKQLAISIWCENGCPPEGHEQYISDAERKLQEALK